MFLDRPILQILMLTLAHAWVLISENLLLRDGKNESPHALQRTSISILVLLLVSIGEDLSAFYWAWGYRC